jgi:hypothetical protein
MTGMTACIMHVYGVWTACQNRHDVQLRPLQTQTV